MNDEGREKRMAMLLAVAAALLLPVALAVAGAWVMWSSRKAEEPAGPSPEQVEQLRAAVERAAETALPVPSFLASDAVVLELAPDRFEPELQRVVRLATGLGGSASSWNDGTSVRIVARVPEANASVFRDALQRGVYDIAAAGEGKPSTIVEVLLKPAVETKPRPKKKTR